jgi:hypothetical protein
MSFPTISLYKVEFNLFSPMSLESLIPITIWILIGLHVFNLNYFNMFSIYVVCDIEMFVVDNEKSTPQYFPSFPRSKISNRLSNCCFNHLKKEGDLL